jgi:hypothetical protein
MEGAIDMPFLIRSEAINKFILAILWNLKTLEVTINYSTVYGWLRSMLNSDRPVRARGLEETLVRRRLSLLEDIIAGKVSNKTRPT